LDPQTPNKNRRGANRRVTHNKTPERKLSIKEAAWSHDQALLDQSFPDTQIWNFNSEHEPRFGKANSKDNKIFNVVQTAVNRQWLTSSTSVVGTQARAFQLADLAQASSWTSVFDQYRIMQVEVWLRPTTNYTTNANSASMYTVIDYDDAIPLASENAAQQYENVTLCNINSGVYRRFRPHIAVAAFQPSAFAGYQNKVSDWIDCGYPTVSHYGFKALISVTTGTLNYDLEYRYWVQFRNVF